MVKKTKYTHSQIESIRQAYKEGTPLKRIAQDHNLKYGQVTYIIYRVDPAPTEMKSSAQPKEPWTWAFIKRSLGTLGFK